MNLYDAFLHDHLFVDVKFPLDFFRSLFSVFFFLYFSGHILCLMSFAYIVPFRISKKPHLPSLNSSFIIFSASISWVRPLLCYFRLKLSLYYSSFHYIGKLVILLWIMHIWIRISIISHWNHHINITLVLWILSFLFALTGWLLSDCGC